MSEPDDSGPTYTYDNAAGIGLRSWDIRAIMHGNDRTEWHRQRPYLPGGMLVGPSFGLISGEIFEAPPIATPGPLLSLRIKGARCLFDMTMRVVADNIATLEIGNLDVVPFRVTYRIWNFLVRDDRPIPLQSYLVLATCLAKQHRKYGKEDLMPKGLFHFNHAIGTPFLPLLSYIKPLTSNSFDFIVHLVIAHVRISFSEHEFLVLSDLKNLGVLEIIQPNRLTLHKFPRITDSIIRHWSEVPNPFPILRVLRIWGFDCTTFRSLTYLNKFPSLVVYDVAGRKRDWQGELQPPFFDPNWDWERIYYSPSKYDSIFRSFYERYPTPVCFPSWMTDGNAGPLSPPQNTGTGSYDMPGLQLQEVMITKRDHIQSLTQAATLMPYQLDNIGDRLCLHYIAYMLYCQIGHSWSDKDLAAQGVSDADKAFVMDDRHLIPPRPYVTINFGTCCNHVCRRWEWVIYDNPRLSCSCQGYSNAAQTRYTFIRKKKNEREKRERSPSPSNGLSSKYGPSDKPASGPKLRKKRRKFSMGDL
ncbi:hypothetical protein K445DRAFT_378473 [Daldinia sp. EC12]|nr:hypothetical protein K445DRAFT_378473 [Daldinia sp. EC12]